VSPSAHDHRSPKERLGEEATKNEALEIEALNPATFSYTIKPLSTGGVGRLRGLTVKHLLIKIAATAMSFPESICLSAQAFFDYTRDAVSGRRARKRIS
jgi:hypothetical protein